MVRLSLLLLDIDRFKGVNDPTGHAVCILFLQEIGVALGLSGS
jgi:GGDEF domain-containing protein